MLYSVEILIKSKRLFLIKKDIKYVGLVINLVREDRWNI